MFYSLIWRLRLNPRLAILSLCGLAAIIALLILFLGGGRGTSAKPQVVVVAATATANESAPVLGQRVLHLLWATGASSTDGAAWVISPATGQPAQVALTPRRADGQVEYGPRRGQMLDANISRVEALARKGAAAGRVDLLASMAAASRITSGPATLILVSSGLTTAGGFDLRQVGWDADPATVAAELENRGLLPDLRGWTIVFSGLGDTAGRQPSLPLPQRATLTAYWIAICHATGAVRCVIDDTPRPDLPSRSTAPVPIVPVPQVSSVQGPHHSNRTIVPAEDLFAFGSAKLGPGTDRILAPLAAQARAWHLHVSITGQASPDGGSDAYNASLSGYRALAVRARLVALGVPARQITHVTGIGTAGEPPDACYSTGRLNEATCAQLRRVVIVLSPNSAVSS